MYNVEDNIKKGNAKVTFKLNTSHTKMNGNKMEKTIPSFVIQSYTSIYILLTEIYIHVCNKIFKKQFQYKKQN